MIYFYIQNGDVLDWQPNEDDPNLPFGKNQMSKVISANCVGAWVDYTPNEQGHLVDNELARYISDVAGTFGWGCLHSYKQQTAEVYTELPERQYLDLEYFICSCCGNIKNVTLTES